MCIYIYIYIYVYTCYLFISDDPSTEPRFAWSSEQGRVADWVAPRLLKADRAHPVRFAETPRRLPSRPRVGPPGLGIPHSRFWERRDGDQDWGF